MWDPRGTRGTGGHAGGSRGIPEGPEGTRGIQETPAGPEGTAGGSGETPRGPEAGGNNGGIEAGRKARGARQNCWVLPGLDNGPCLSGPVRPLRLVVCVISSLSPARLSPEGSRLLSYLCIISVLPAAVPVCIAVMSVTYASHRVKALALVFG
jgi:hypothetical protein